MEKISEPRAVRVEEFPSLRKLEDTVFRPRPNTSMLDEFPTLFSPENCEHVRVISDGDEIVSCTAFQVRDVSIYGSTVSVASLGAVCTYKEYRGRGFASLLLEDAYSVARAAGADVMFISGGRGLYQRAGCIRGGHELRFTISPSAADDILANTDIMLSPVQSSEIDTLTALHRTEPVRFIRSPLDWQRLITLFDVGEALEPVPTGVKRGWIIRVNGRPMAYVVLNIGRSDRGNLRAGLDEYAGARKYVFAGVAQLIKDYSLEYVSGSLLPGDVVGDALLAQVGVETVRDLLGGHTISILHADIFARYERWLVEQVGPSVAAGMALREDAGTWSLVSGSDEIHVGDIAKVNEVLFADAVHELEGSADVRALWEAVLPLPWVKPGLNYI